MFITWKQVTKKKKKKVQKLNRVGVALVRLPSNIKQCNRT